MKCSIQWLCEHTFILRTHPTGGYGDEYTFAVTARMSDKQALLYGALKSPTMTEWRAIRTTLREMGFENAKWERKNKLERTVIKR